MKNYLEYLEIPIVEFCNLNCKGCSHLSPLASKEDYMSLAEVRSDLTRLKEIIPHIEKIRILGGEPFLHNELFEILYCVREVYSQTDIRVVTNGLLIKKMQPEFWKAFTDNNIILDISMYPPTVQQWDSIREVLESFGVKYECTEHITRFRKRISLTYNEDIERNFAECVIGNKCNCLYKGRISTCPTPFVVKHFNKHYGYDIQCENDWLDIYDSTLSTEKVIKFVKSPLSVCGY